MCWEDAQVDLQLLDLTEESSMCMIGSAGCNALSYLTAYPATIFSVDSNPCQTALLELKYVLIQQGEEALFRDFFIRGKSEQYKSSYARIRSFLSNASTKYWDRHLHFFNPQRKGFFYEGGAGYFARILNRIIDSSNVRNSVTDLLCEHDLQTRKVLYQSIEERLFSGIQKYAWKKKVFLSLAGVPNSQRRAVGDLNAFMKKVLYTIFVEQSAHANPYWKTYINGYMDAEHTHLYLRKEHFELLRERIHRLRFETNLLNIHLSRTNQSYSHFILLDHMDWMAENDQSTLAQQWNSLFKCAEKGAQVLFRTAYSSLDFLPEFIHEKIDLKKIDEDWVKQHDRVGTYTGTYLGTIH